MHPTAEAALTVTNQSFDMLREVLEGLPDAALDWTPMSGTNSIAVLTIHSITATAFLFAAAAGVSEGRDEYRQGIRARAFATRGQAAAGLRSEIDAVTAELPDLAAKIGDADLAARLPWAEEDGHQRTGAECLVNAVGHLREHVGQAQLMRDLWLSGSREGR